MLWKVDLKTYSKPDWCSSKEVPFHPCIHLCHLQSGIEVVLNSVKYKGHSYSTDIFSSQEYEYIESD